MSFAEAVFKKLTLRFMPFAKRIVKFWKEAMDSQGFSVAWGTRELQHQSPSEGFC